MGNALVVSLVIASAFIAGVVLMNYLANNLPYEEPSAVYMETVSYTHLTLPTIYSV